MWFKVLYAQESALLDMLCLSDFVKTQGVFRKGHNSSPCSLWLLEVYLVSQCLLYPSTTDVDTTWISMVCPKVLFLEIAILRTQLTVFPSQLYVDVVFRRMRVLRQYKEVLHLSVFHVIVNPTGGFHPGPPVTPYIQHPVQRWQE